MPWSPQHQKGLAGTILAEIAKEYAAELPAVVERAVRLIAAQESAYGQQGTVPVEDLRETVTANISGMLDVLSGVTPTGESGLSVAHSTGRRRAEQEVALESVLHAYRLGGQTIMGGMLRLAQRRSPAELSGFLEAATAIMEVVDRYSEMVVTGYRQTEAELRRRDSQRQQAMFDALLDGRGADLTIANEAAPLLGLPPKGPYIVAVYTLDLSADHTLSGVRDVCAVYGFAAAWRTRGHREIGIVALGNSPVSRLLDILRATVSGRVGVSGVFESLRDLPSGYRLAETALRTSPPDLRDVAWIDERLPEAMIVVDPELAARLVAHTLGGLASLREVERRMLLDTLAAWFDNGRSAALTAGVLYCHRNTIVNRLRRIEKVTGRSLDNHRDLLACYLAMLALRLDPNAAQDSQPHSA